MSMSMPRPEDGRAAAAKPQRVLACVLCQQRKVKCDRKFPCANCVKAGIKCVPATQTPARQRRRRFPERALLDRLQHYETLLRQNNIEFEPLHKSTAEKASPNEGAKRQNSQGNVHSGESVASSDSPSKEELYIKRESSFEPKNLWETMNQITRDSDDYDDADDDDNDSGMNFEEMRGADIQKEMDQIFPNNDNILFGSRNTSVDLSTLHPEQFRIFKLWQVYVENVNPLLKITHTPTLQARIIDAASDISNIDPALEALMFGIYCASILTLEEEDCQTLFQSSKEDLNTSYQFGCQQALLNCGVLRTNNRDCLTALYLYLLSLTPHTDPRSMASMLGAAVRIAERLGIQNEASNSKYPPLEAEMRRRLWWSLVLFDNRICEVSDYKMTPLAPTWDCKTPLNVNDFDMGPEMKNPPAADGKPTEAIYAVMRSEFGEVIRRCDFHLDFSTPALKSIAKYTRQGPVLEDREELIAFEKNMEDTYLKFCNPENPLHFLTTWTMRAYLAKSQLMEHYSRYSNISEQPNESERKIATSYAFRMLECDTKLTNSPLTKKFLWLLHFPFPAYMHLVQELKLRPTEENAEEFWEVMCQNYEARITNLALDKSPFFKVFSRMILEAWESREAIARQFNKPVELPRMVSYLKAKFTQTSSKSQSISGEQSIDPLDMNLDDQLMSMPMTFAGQTMTYDPGAQDFVGSWTSGYSEIPDQAPMNLDVNQLDWTLLNWNPLNIQRW